MAWRTGDNVYASRENNQWHQLWCAAGWTGAMARNVSSSSIMAYGAARQRAKINLSTAAWRKRAISGMDSVARAAKIKKSRHQQNQRRISISAPRYQRASAGISSVLALSPRAQKKRALLRSHKK